jgi:tetratricopeptide (TPR) repeat protein
LASTEVLSEHFSRAGADKETWETGRLAGKRALERNAPLEAATLLARALASSHRMASLPIAPRAEAAELLGDAWCQAGHLKEGEKAYLAAEELAKTRGDRARLLHKRALVRKREGRYPAALRMLTTALKSLPKAAGPGERAKLELGYAGVRLHQGRYREAIERCDRATSLAEKAGDFTTLGTAYFVRGRAASHLEAGSGVEDAERALDIFESTGDHLMQARVLDLLGGDAYARGAWNEALTLEGRSAEQREFAGDAVGSAVAGYHRARVLLDQGRLDRAESALEEIRTASRAANYPLGVAKSTLHLASAIARGGDSSAALGMLKETLDLFEELDAGRCVIANRLAQAEAHLLSGGVDAALGDAEEALQEAMGIVGVDVPVVGLQRVRGVALVWLGRSSDGHVQLLEALEAARLAGAVFEQALIFDALATLYGDDGAAEQRNAIVERLGIVRLPPFLTP